VIPIFNSGWRTAIPLIHTLLVLTVAPSASAQLGEKDSPSGIECLERLEVPNYPALPRQARIQGTLTVKVQLSDQSSVKSVESTFQGLSGRTNTLFEVDANRAMRESRFLKTCASRPVTLIFHYEFRETEGPLFAFRYPNEFWIRAAPVLVNP